MSTRVKHVVDARQVAHLWAHQSQDSARSAGHAGRGNFYFTGDTIYSYGGHFPIARHVQNKRGEQAVLFTTRRYSVTTSKHLAYAEAAIPAGVVVFHVIHPGNNMGREALDNYAARFGEALGKAAKSRLFTAMHLDDARGLAEEAEAFCKFFGIRFTPSRFGIPADLKGFFAEQAQKQKRAAALAKAKREKSEAEYQDLLLENLPRWFAGESCTRLGPAGVRFQREVFTPDWSKLGRAYFRPAGDEIETTLGARFPTDHGRRAYRMLRAIRARGESYQANGHTIHVGAFQIDSYDHATGVIKAGCHTVDWAEVERLAGVMGWTKSDTVTETVAGAGAPVV